MFYGIVTTKLTHRHFFKFRINKIIEQIKQKDDVLWDCYYKTDTQTLLQSPHKQNYRVNKTGRLFCMGLFKAFV